MIQLLEDRNRAEQLSPGTVLLQGSLGLLLRDDFWLASSSVALCPKQQNHGKVVSVHGTLLFAQAEGRQLAGRRYLHACVYENHQKVPGMVPLSFRFSMVTW